MFNVTPFFHTRLRDKRASVVEETVLIPLRQASIPLVSILQCNLPQNQIVLKMSQIELGS
jgi:hypothetical protein